MTDLVALAAELGPLTNTTGRRFMFSPATMEKGAELGLDGIEFYFGGRAGPLGDCEPSVVSSAFMFFNPDFVEPMVAAARSKVPARETGHAYAAACQQWGREHLDSVPELDRFCAAAANVVNSADGAGMALFAGWRCEPLPDDTPGRAALFTQILRELRGGVHGLAVLGHGLHGVETTIVHGPDAAKLVGWSEPFPDPGPLRPRWEAAEEATNKRMAQLLGVLSSDELDAFAAGTRAIHATTA